MIYRTDNLPDLHPGSLVGSWFYSRDWHGQVVGEPHPGFYLVEIMALDARPTRQELVDLADMVVNNWWFYDTAERMYDHSKAPED